MDAKDTFFCTKQTLNCKGKLVQLDSPKVMGIVNLTDNSFYDGGQLQNDQQLLDKVQVMVKDGATFIDIGACSTRPKSLPVPLELEMERIQQAVGLIRKHFPDLIISIDTFRSEVARAGLLQGADIINDVSAGDMDNKMTSVILEFGCPYIIMHMQGTPETMQDNPSYGSVTKEVLAYLSKKVFDLKRTGINDIIIDPGFGFGKSQFHNFRLLKDLHLFKMIGVPVLAGLSRKSIVNKTLGTNPATALNGTTIANTLALLNGADIVRVHDVKEAVEVIKMVNFYNSIGETE
jgi:dihydropteroate synthase